jgi:5-methylcytosine-specific restriction protein A
MVDVETLRDGSGEVCEMDHVGPVDPQIARRVACDGAIRRVVMEGKSEPLDVARSTPKIPAAMRRAVIIRDRHCQWPGCDRPPSWCDVHHAWPWEEGGTTCKENLILLCRRHHRMLHKRHGFRLRIDRGRPLFFRPNGSLLIADGRAPP